MYIILIDISIRHGLFLNFTLYLNNEEDMSKSPTPPGGIDFFHDNIYLAQIHGVVYLVYRYLNAMPMLRPQSIFGSDEI